MAAFCRLAKSLEGLGLDGAGLEPFGAGLGKQKTAQKNRNSIKIRAGHAFNIEAGSYQAHILAMA